MHVLGIQRLRPLEVVRRMCHRHSATLTGRALTVERQFRGFRGSLRGRASEAPRASSGDRSIRVIRVIRVIVVQLLILAPATASATAIEQEARSHGGQRRGERLATAARNSLGRAGRDHLTTCPILPGLGTRTSVWCAVSVRPVSRCLAKLDCHDAKDAEEYGRQSRRPAPRGTDQQQCPAPAGHTSA